MAKKQLYEMTNGEKYERYKRNHHLAMAGKWTSVIAPFTIVFGAKFNEYFILVDNNERIKLTIGCVAAIIVAVVAIYREAKKSANKNIAPVIGWGVALALIWLCKTVLDDLLLIVGSEFAGQMAGAGLNVYSDFCSKEAEEYKRLARADNTLGVKTPKKEKEKAATSARW